MYPNGYERDVIKFPNAKGEMISAVRVETEDTIYLIKVSSQLKQMFDDLDIEEMDFSNEEKDDIDGDEDSDDQYSKDKPVDDYELQTVLNRWLEKQQKEISSQQLALMKELLDNSHKTKTRVALPTSDGLEFLEITDIIRCESDNNYTRIFCNDKTHYLICRTLKDVEKVLGENGFIRIHQSHLINPKYIRKLLRNDGGIIVMTDGTELGISRAKKDRLYEMLAGVEKL